MASTHSDSLRIELQTTGEQSGTWGTTENTQKNLLEDAIAGTSTIAFASDANDTATTANGSADEARNMFLLLSGGATLTATRNMVVPDKSKMYVVKNGTTGSQSVQIIGTGTGITIPTGETMFLWNDGTNVVDAVTNFSAGIKSGGAVIATTTGTETLTNKTLTAPQINDTSSNHQYILGVSELASDRTITLPLLAGNDTFVFAAFTQTLTNKTLGATALSGTMSFADNIASRPVLKDYGETVNAIGDLGGGTDDIDITSGNVVTATVSSSEQTFTFSNPSASGTACSFTLFLTNGGSQTVNWPASVDWAGGSAPSLTASGVDILTFVTLDAGTIWHGMIASADSS